MSAISATADTSAPAPAPTSRRRRLRWIAVRVAAVAALAAALAAFLRLRRDPPATPSRHAEAVRGTLAMSVTATGTVAPRNTVDVGSEVSGRVRRIAVADNDRVEKGQVIAEIDRELLEAQLEQARAIRAQSEAQLAQAKVTQRETALARARGEALFARGTIALQELEAVRAAAERAIAAVALGGATVRQAAAAEKVVATALAKAAIRSPIEGVVLSHSVEVGQTVVAAFQAPVLFKIAEDLRAMKVEVDIDEADIGKVKVGQRARFTVAAYLDRAFEARVVLVHNAARIVDRVVTYRADLAVDNPDLALRPGMTATAEILVGEVRDAILVPAQALRVSPGGFVWVLRHGIEVPVAIAVLGETETTVAIRGPVERGDQVVVGRAP